MSSKPHAADEECYCMDSLNVVCKRHAGGMTATRATRAYPAPPSHYAAGPEPWDIIDAYKLNYYAGSALAYILRYAYKGDSIGDIRKAIAFLQRELERLESAS